MREDKNSELSIIIWGIVTMIIIVGLWVLTYFLLEDLSYDDRGTFGDMFGSVNALFSGLALAGIIFTILLQRKELGFQRIELKSTRKEFLLNRTTNLVYKQLVRFEEAIKDFSIKDIDGEVYKGNNAFIFLDENKLFNNQFAEPSKEENKNRLIKILKIISLNESEINNLAHRTYHTVEALKILIFKSELDINYINDLKSIFFENIGFINLQVINHFNELSKSKIEILDPEDYGINGISIHSIMYSRYFFESIYEFYILHLTNENFKEEKLKWLKENRKLNDK